MNKYQQEIEKLLDASERIISRELQQAYKELADDISKEIILLQKEIDETDKFPKKLQKERLEAIRNQMDRKINILEQDQKSSIWSFLRFNGDTAYNSLFYEFEMSEKIPLAFSMLTDKQINVIINTPVASRKLSTRLKGNTAKMKKNLNRVLVSGFGKGLSTQKMARQIADIGGAEYRRAMTIARTEAGRVTGVTRQQSQQHAKEVGLQVKKKWVSTLDGDTRTSHRELDGQIKEIEERFKVGRYSTLQPHMFGIASEDCNCRCVSISIIEGYDPELRRDNESHEVMDYKNYNDWSTAKKAAAEAKAAKEAASLFNNELTKKIANNVIKDKAILTNLDNENKLIKSIADTRNELDELRDKINESAIEFRKKNLTLNQRYEDGLLTYDEYNKALDRLTSQYNDTDLRKLHSELLKKFRVQEGELLNLKHKNSFGNAERIKSIFSNYREMGISDHDLKKHLSSVRSRAGKAVVNAYDVMPTDWLKRSIDFGDLKLKTVKRGYYRHGSPAELALSERYGEHNSFRTAIHELTHRQEHINDDILRAEKTFYEERTHGENVVRLKDIYPGSNYRPEEITRVDNFLDAYMGKDYGGRAYEILSMGLDTFYTRPLDLAKDRDMFEWVIEVLLNF